MSPIIRILCSLNPSSGLIWGNRRRMVKCVLVLVTLLVSLSLPISDARLKRNDGKKSAVFLSPKFELSPGLVAEKYFFDIDFPRGHIAIKYFNAEVVDEAGNPVPLHVTYLHHWLVVRYYQRKGVTNPKYNENLGLEQSDIRLVKNSGLCESGLSQYFGLGSETRKTETHVPDPYGIEVGNPSEIPPGYEEKWVLNVHAIDTRGAEDRMGCTECRCDLYNVTKNRHGEPLSPGYIGGLACCHDGVQCKVKEGFTSAKRSLYMRYTVEWVEFDANVVPVQIYILDVTDTWKKSDGSSGLGAKHHCLIEYKIETCSATGGRAENCEDTRRVALTMPKGGVVVYGVAHQHTGGVGSTLYGEDGRVICSSRPTYGSGKGVGDEAGYIVGMSTCYPHPGSVAISDGETLVLESNYNSSRMHTGVMGLFYLLVADASPGDMSSSRHGSFDVSTSFPLMKHEKMAVPVSLWGMALFGGVVVVALALAYRRQKSDEQDGYQSIAT